MNNTYATHMDAARKGILTPQIEQVPEKKTFPKSNTGSRLSRDIQSRTCSILSHQHQTKSHDWPT